MNKLFWITISELEFLLRNQTQDAYFNYVSYKKKKKSTLQRNNTEFWQRCHISITKPLLVIRLLILYFQIACNPVYSGFYDIVVNMFPKFNIEVSFVQAGCSVEEYKKHIKPNTKACIILCKICFRMCFCLIELFGFPILWLWAEKRRAH